MSGTVSGLMKQAKRALDSCRLLIDDEDFDGACNRAYYAMFNAAQAALKSAGLREPAKTHSGLATVFGQRLIQTTKLPVEMGRSLSRVMNVRAAADYEGDIVDADVAVGALTEATAFVAAIEAALPIL